jgi:hypothetical protein
MKITTSKLKNIIRSVLQEQETIGNFPPAREDRRGQTASEEEALDAGSAAGEWVTGAARDVTADILGLDYPPHRDAGLTPDEYDYARQYLVKSSGHPEWEFTPQEVRGAANTMRMRQRLGRQHGPPASPPGVVKDPLRKQQLAPDYDAFKRDLYEMINEEVDVFLEQDEQTQQEPWPDPGTPEWDARMETTPQWSDEYTDQMLRLRNQELGVAADEPYSGPFGSPTAGAEETVASR